MDPPVKTAPLPDNPFDPYTQKDCRQAFDSCKRLEQSNSWGFLKDLSPQPNERGLVMLATSPTVAARTLGYALIYAPSVKGRDELATEVISCQDNQEWLAGLAHLYIFGLLRICTSTRSPQRSLGIDVQTQAQSTSTGSTPAISTPAWLRDKANAPAESTSIH